MPPDTPVFVIADEDLLRWPSLFRVARDYATSERARVVLTGPLDGLAVHSRKRRFHTAREVNAIARQRLAALARAREEVWVGREGS